MAKYVRITLPIDQPKESLELADAIIKKNTAEGAGSSLADVIDIADFTAKAASAKAKRASAAEKDQAALSKYGWVSTKTGFAPGQTRDTKETIQWYVRQAKDLLLVIHSGTEEDLNPYGFEVIISQTGARKNIRIELPEQPTEMIELAEAIIAHHTALGAGSPLTAALIDMTAFETLTTDARTLLDDWTVLRGEIQALNNEALNIIGYGPGQTISTDGTLYNYFSKIRNRLLQKFQGNEEDLSMWGFNVVQSEKQTGRKKGSGTASITGTVTDTLGNKLNGALVLVIQPDIFVSTNAQGKYEVPALPPGTYTLLIHKSGYAEKQVNGVVVAEGATTTLNVVMASAGTFGIVSGQITKAGLGVPGSVTITLSGTPVANPSDSSGYYEINNVPPGNYSLQGSANSNPADIITHNISVVAGETTTVNFVFP